MRSFKRPAISAAQARYLRKRRGDAKLKEIAGTLEIEAHWKSSRGTKVVGVQLLGLLHGAVGPRMRCMYCSDSHGSDIDHFFPKSQFRLSAYNWRNFVLSCTPCGRLKGDRFPMVNGRPQLINPLSDKPWRHLTFDPTTGNLTAKFHVAGGAFDARGVETVQILQLDRRQGLAEGYLRSYRRIKTVISAFLDAPGPAAVLIADIAREDEYDLGGWIFGTPLHADQEIVQLQQLHPLVWADCVTHFAP